MPKILTQEEKNKRLAEKQEVAARKEITKIKKQCIERILKKNINWPAQLKIINQLVESYPNIDFWRSFNVNFSFTLPSLAWFLTEKGKDYLAQEYRRQTTDLSALTRREEQPELNDEPVEQIQIK